MKSIQPTSGDQGRDDREPRRVGAAVDLLFRRRAGQLTATLTRVFGLDQLDLVEDVVQDAFVQALRRWPSSGVPDNPGAWILQVAKNRAVDALRRQGRWRDKQAELERSLLPETARSTGEHPLFSGEIADDELRMIFAACHPAIPPDARAALTLKTVGGFGVSEIASAFLASEPAISQRIVRAKRTLREEDVSFTLPAGPELRAHLDSVLEVIYLMFNEGYSPAVADVAVRSDLCGEAIRLVELLAEHPTVAEPRVDALAALFLFQASRARSRTTAEGEVVPLRDQDRSLWDRAMIRRALVYLERSARGDHVTSYHLQAEIAAGHTLAATYEDTPWSEILECYEHLLTLEPSPIVALNRAVALSEIEGPEAGLDVVRQLKDDEALASYHYLYAIEADLLARAGRYEDAERVVSKAIALVNSLPLRLLLERRARTYRRQS